MRRILAPEVTPSRTASLACEFSRSMYNRAKELLARVREAECGRAQGGPSQLQWPLSIRFVD
jgi:hypothetical protein